MTLSTETFDPYLYTLLCDVRDLEIKLNNWMANSGGDMSAGNEVNNLLIQMTRTRMAMEKDMGINANGQINYREAIL